MNRVAGEERREADMNITRATREQLLRALIVSMGFTGGATSLYRSLWLLAA
jgi:hypothetical protein